MGDEQMTDREKTELWRAKAAEELALMRMQGRRQLVDRTRRVVDLASKLFADTTPADRPSDDLPGFMAEIRRLGHALENFESLKHGSPEP